MYVGIAAGPIVGGFIVEAAGNFITIFYAAFVCHLFFIIFVTSFVPESLSRPRQLAARETYQAQALKSRSFPSQPGRPALTALTHLSAILHPLRILRPGVHEESSATRRNLVLLSAIDTVVFSITLGSGSLLVIYAELNFKWGNFESSIFASITNTCRVGMLLLVLPILNRIASIWFGMDGFQAIHCHGRPSNHGSGDTFNIAIIRASILFDVVGYLGYALSPSGVLFTISGIMASAGGVASPIIQSFLTLHVDETRTGELLGAMSLLHALGRIILPALLNGLYGLSVAWFRGLVWWVLALVLATAAAGAWAIRGRFGVSDGVLRGVR